MTLSCTTIKPGTPCVHMAKKGCTFAGGKCQPIIEKCVGCAEAHEASGEKYCRTYASPSYMWRDGICAYATHVEKVIVTTEKKVNPLKASKRASRGG